VHVLPQSMFAVVQVVCSRDVKIAGLLGSAAAIEGKSSAVAEQQVGSGGTTKWRLASLVSCADITEYRSPSVVGLALRKQPPSVNASVNVLCVFLRTVSGLEHACDFQPRHCAFISQSARTLLTSLQQATSPN